MLLAKQRIYYIVESEDKSFNKLANPFLPNTYMLDVEAVAEDKKSLRVLSHTVNQRFFISVESLQKIANLKQIINIILN